MSSRALLMDKARSLSLRERVEKQPYLQSFLGSQNFCIELTKLIQPMRGGVGAKVKMKEVKQHMKEASIPSFKKTVSHCFHLTFHFNFSKQGTWFYFKCLKSMRSQIENKVRHCLNHWGAHSNLFIH